MKTDGPTRSHVVWFEVHWTVRTADQTTDSGTEPCSPHKGSYNILLNSGNVVDSIAVSSLFLSLSLSLKDDPAGTKCLSLSVPVSLPPVSPSSSVEKCEPFKLLDGIAITVPGWLVGKGVIPSQALLHKAFCMLLAFLALALLVKLFLSASAATPSDEGILAYHILLFHLAVCESIFTGFLQILSLKVPTVPFLRSWLEFMGLILVGLAVPLILQFNCSNIERHCQWPLFVLNWNCDA